MSVLIGVDLGQRREPTAICVVEAQMRRSVYGEEQHFLVRYLERMEIGTSYPSAAQQTARIVTEVNPLGDGVSVVYVDATGLGQPVIEIFENRVQEARVTPVYFTHGDRRHIGESQEVVLGKAYLVARLQTLLQTGCLHLPRTAEAEQLAKNLLDYEIHVDADANDRYGAFKVGRQDDLITALGLAVQGDPPAPGIYVLKLRDPSPIRVSVPLLGGYLPRRLC